MDARTRAWIDQEDAQMRTVVRRHGWMIRYVGGGCNVPGCECPPDDGPAFAYTVGLFGLAHPELLIFGVAPETAMSVLNALGERIRSGEDLIPDRLVSLPQWPHHLIPETVPNPGAIAFDANRFYRRRRAGSVPVLQLGYCDDEDRFPWEDGYSGPEQPRPGTFTA
ncbi:MAG TPA: DUF4262 domain-containing protein [Acidimicrobiia bacterium]|jgi:hypothetical protein